MAVEMKDPDSKNEVPAQQHRRWWKRKRWWLAGVVAALLVCIYTIPRFPFGPYTLYSDLTVEELADKIPYETLSSEKTHPFPKSAGYYEEAVRKFSDVQSCLIETETSKKEPDLRLINWDAFQNTPDIEVCVWRISASLGTLKRVEKWMKFHDFNTASRQYDAEHMAIGFAIDAEKNEILTVLYGNRNPRYLRSRIYQKGSKRLMVGLLFHSEGFQTIWREDGKIARVNMNNTFN